MSMGLKNWEMYYEYYQSNYRFNNLTVTNGITELAGLSLIDMVAFLLEQMWRDNHAL